jgi:hypothetical protein
MVHHLPCQYFKRQAIWEECTPPEYNLRVVFQAATFLSDEVISHYRGFTIPGVQYWHAGIFLEDATRLPRRVSICIELLSEVNLSNELFLEAFRRRVVIEALK